ncbi:MAG: hypothetical protein CM15mP4_3440 [Candidatus Neomarinimicrobiota bacterium]|nr:MAG: hypothetical protein CM15mP4_3440 [Candidatus Neomarinimicrobiota bacterium]
MEAFENLDQKCGSMQTWYPLKMKVGFGPKTLIYLLMRFLMFQDKIADEIENNHCWKRETDLLKTSFKGKKAREYFPMFLVLQGLGMLKGKM